MSEINLLKNELKKGAPLSFVPKTLLGLYVVLGIFAAELLLYGGLFFYQQKVEGQARDYEQRTAAIDLEIERVSAERKLAVSFQQRLNNLQALLQQHVFWTEGLKELEDHTLKTVFLRTLQVDDGDGVFIITGTAPTVSDLGKYLFGLRQSRHVTNAEVKSIARSQSGQAGYDFNAEVTFDTKLLQK